MAVTRKQLADTIDEYDTQIAELQAGKRETYQSYREELTATAGKDAAKAEIEAFKVALKRRQAIAKKGEEVIEDKDALADEIFAEISATRAPRAMRMRTREIIEEFSTPPASQETTAADPAEGVIASSADTNVPEPLRYASRSEPTDIAGKERPESASDILEPYEGTRGEMPRTAAAPVAEGVSPNASSVTPFLAITAGGQAIKHQGAVS